MPSTKQRLTALLATATATLALSACSGVVSGAQDTTEAAAAVDPATVQPKGIVGAGPNGEKAVTPDTVELTDAQADKVRADLQREEQRFLVVLREGVDRRFGPRQVQTFARSQRPAA